MKVLFVIPAYNEEANIENVIKDYIINSISIIEAIFYSLLNCILVNDVKQKRC